MSEKKSVSAWKVLKSAFGELSSDPFMYLILVAPIYILTGFSMTFDDFIIVHNEDFKFYNYSANSYYIGFIYILFEAYIFSIIAVAIHNKIIKRNIVFKFFSKGVIIYTLFYLSSYGDFIFYFSQNFNYIILIPVVAVLIIAIILSLLAFLWILYLPNISVEESHSFFYIIKNSYGARLTIIVQAIYFTIIFLIPYLIISSIGSHSLGVIYTTPFLFILGVTMLSCTYLEWKELERYTAEKNS